MTAPLSHIPVILNIAWIQKCTVQNGYCSPGRGCGGSGDVTACTREHPLHGPMHTGARGWDRGAPTLTHSRKGSGSRHGVLCNSPTLCMSNPHLFHPQAQQTLSHSALGIKKSNRRTHTFTDRPMTAHVETPAPKAANQSHATSPLPINALPPTPSLLRKPAPRALSSRSLLSPPPLPPQHQLLQGPLFPRSPPSAISPKARVLWAPLPTYSFWSREFETLELEKAT